MSLNLFMFFVFTFISVTIISSIIDGHSGLATTALTADLTETATSMDVLTTDPFPNQGLVVIGSETICYTSKAAQGFLGLTRGGDCRQHSEVSAHDSGVMVQSEAVGVINTLIGFDITSAFADGGFIGLAKGIYQSAKNAPAILSSVSRMVMWDYSFLDGSFVYVKYLLLYPLSAGMVLSFIRLALGR